MNNASWDKTPANGEWNTGSNWSSDSVPTDTATFGASSKTNITFSTSDTPTINQIEFTADAPAYTFTFDTSTSPELTISGQGVSNSALGYQSFIVAATTSGYQNPQLKFTNSANAGDSNVFYCAGPVDESGPGGGVISFCDTTSAGSASFKAWTGAQPPQEPSTVGGEISFSDSSTAATATFTIYGTLGNDGDTFGNVVFHDNSTAANGIFTNIGGTVSGGDGGNTQFYNSATAANGIFNNLGGTHEKSNGGDVAFDGTANGGYGFFYNHAAPAQNAYGGVTSFNNNPPTMQQDGASAGNGIYHNYGARNGELGGGGHMEFSAKYGWPTAANATIINYGSDIEGNSSAGHTIFSINTPTEFYPTAGYATIRNLPGTTKGAAPGYTEFAVYQNEASSASDTGGENVPTAGNSTIYNEGGDGDGVSGGKTIFSDTASAGQAILVAYDGTSGGYGGQIIFYGQASGGAAYVKLYGSGELSIGGHTGALTMSTLEANEGTISTQLGDNVTTLNLSDKLYINSQYTSFYFWTKDGGGFTSGTSYAILCAPNLSDFSSDNFTGNQVDGLEPSFSIDKNTNTLSVSFS